MGEVALRAREHAGHTASVIVVRPLVTHAATLGVDTKAMLAEVRLRPESLGDVDHRISDDVHVRLWRYMTARFTDDAFGLHVAESFRTGDYDVLEYALRSSASLHDAFDRMSRFHRILCDAMVTRIEVRGHTAFVHTAYEDHGPRAAECFLAFLTLRAREVTGPGLALREVRFAHAAPRDTTLHASFFGCPVKFRSASAGIVFDARDFAREVHVATPGLAGILDRYMSDLLARLPGGDGLPDRVRHAVAVTMHKQTRPSLDATARALKASPRTVQRWLEERGTTHRQIVDAVRRDLAVRHLEARQLSITEIAFLLGFADIGGFERTFKRWTGKTPSSVRSAATT